MKIKGFIFSLALLMLVSQPCFLVAQPAETVEQTVVDLDLQTIIDTSISDYPGMHAAQKATEALQAQYDEARHSWVLPKFEATSLLGPVPDVPTGSGPPNFPDVNQGFSADFGIFYRLQVDALQPIYTFGRLQYAKRAAKAGVNLSQDEELKQLHDLIFNAKQVFFGLCALNTVSDFLIDIEGKLSGIEERINKMIANNSPEVTESDRLKVQVFRADLESRKWEAVKSQKALLYALALLMGKGADISSWQIEDKNFSRMSVDAFDMNSALTWVSSNNPQLRQLNNLVDLRRSLLRINEGNMLPLVFLGGTFLVAVAPGREDQDNPFLSDPFNNITGGVALGLKQNLDFHLMRDRSAKARAEYEKAQFEKQLGESAIMNDVRVKVVAADIEKKRLEALAKGLRAARSWMAAELNNHEFGIAATDDVIEAMIAYIKARLEYINALNRRFRTVAELTKVTYHELLPVRYSGDGR